MPIQPGFQSVMFILAGHFTSTHPQLHSPLLSVLMSSSKFLLRQDYLRVQQGTWPRIRSGPGRVVQVFRALEIGQQLAQHLVVYTDSL